MPRQTTRGQTDTHTLTHTHSHTHTLTHSHTFTLTLTLTLTLTFICLFLLHRMTVCRYQRVRTALWFTLRQIASTTPSALLVCSMAAVMLVVADVHGCGATQQLLSRVHTRTRTHAHTRTHTHTHAHAHTRTHICACERTAVAGAATCSNDDAVCECASISSNCQSCLRQLDLEADAGVVHIMLDSVPESYDVLQSVSSPIATLQGTVSACATECSSNMACIAFIVTEATFACELVRSYSSTSTAASGKHLYGPPHCTVCEPGFAVDQMGCAGESLSCRGVNTDDTD